MLFRSGTSLPSRGEIAKMIKISKTQIASVASEAIAAGFLVGEGREGLMPTPLLLERYRRWMAISFAFFMAATALPAEARPVPVEA